MKTNFKSLFFPLAILFVALLMNGCQAEEEEPISTPVLRTSAVKSITASSAIFGGNISADGGAAITDRGVCWSTAENPTIADSKIANGTSTGVYENTITGLAANTVHYVRAYATNQAGTAYGQQVSFTTSSGVVSLATTMASSIMLYSAKSGGSITSNGGSAITARGICWSKSSSPTMTDSIRTLTGNATPFTIDMTHLEQGTTYHVRAFATNGIGTSYGNEITFTTVGLVTDIDGNVYQPIFLGTQVWLREYLKTTKLNDGTDLPNITDNTNWVNATSSAYCFYNNNIANKDVSGALYNFYAVSSGKLCPAGWHIPSHNENLTLISYLYYKYGDYTAKTIASTSGWTTYSAAGAVGNDQASNNSSGLSTYPGGQRQFDGSFSLMGGLSSWWSTTRSDFDPSNTIRIQTILYSDAYLTTNFVSNYKNGLSVRCIKN
ncbi:MAG: fibrobacter succinogenes major paralogous domain-containing protein [Bacteroidales bacterium]|nr:fibrobacter succinogenes major paralogous domain-containing protein [Bacteroidales bacterium]